MKRRLKINGFIIFIAFAAIVIFPKIFFSSGKSAIIDGLTDILGVTIILTGQLLRISARGAKSEYSLQGERLIKIGPYSLARNPMYLGIFLIGTGVVILLFRWWTIAIFLLVFVVRYLLLILKEEKKLLALFSDEYRDYCKKTPRLFPSPGKILKQNWGNFVPLKPSWLKKEMGSTLTLLFVSILIESWEDIKNEGIKGYFKEVLVVSIVVAVFACLIIYLIRKTKSLGKYIPN